MKVLLISDNHYDSSAVDKIIEKEIFDISIHLGDSQLSEEWVKERFNYYVAGNNDDFFSPEEVEIEINGLKILLLHGHTRGIYVFTQTRPVEKIIENKQYDIIMHGHTHIYRDEKIADTRVICPGSTTYPRGPEGKSYMMVNIDEKSNVTTELKKLWF